MLTAGYNIPHACGGGLNIATIKQQDTIIHKCMYTYMQLMLKQLIPKVYNMYNYNSMLTILCN